MRRDTYPEWKPWQQTCRVCERVKCPKPEVVGEWLGQLIGQLHNLVHPDLKGHMGWRWQAANYEALLQCFTLTWSWALRGVCPDCIHVEAPEVAAHLDSPDLVHFDAMVRWSCLHPEGGAVGLVRAHTGRGLVRVPAVWRGRGLAVHASVDFFAWSACWAVTHEPSGWRVTSAQTKDDATAVAQLLAEVVDWEALDVATIKADLALRGQVVAVLELLSVDGGEA